MKICLVSSCGGHLAELRALSPAYSQYDHFFVLDDRVLLPPDLEGRTQFVRHAERTWRVLVNVWEAMQIVRRERPDLIMSAGAGIAVSFGLAGKLLGVPMLFVETCARVHKPSLSGRLVYRLADRFFYQWPELERYYPEATYGGPLL